MIQATHQQRGATLIEVMVSILIVAFGVLAMIALQTNAVKFTKTSEYRSIATLLANDLADRMRVNPDGVSLLGYTTQPNTKYTAPQTTPTRSECTAPTSCTAVELAARDMGEWKRALFFSLPGGNGFVRPTADNSAADIWIAWLDPGESNPITEASNGCPAGFLPTTVPDTLHCVYFRVSLK